VPVIVRFAPSAARPNLHGSAPPVFVACGLKSFRYLLFRVSPSPGPILALYTAAMRTLLSFFIASSTILVAQSDGREIARRSVFAAERNWKARQSYTYTVRDEERHLDSQGRVKSTDVDVSKAVLVNGYSIEQTVSHNGGLPTPARQKKDDDSLRKRRSETPSEGAARLREDKEKRAFIDEVPDAFNFRLLGEEVVRGRPAYVLEVTPKPGFHAHSKYSMMFSKVHGKIWVDAQDFGWVKVDVDVMEPFSMGLFLARVQPGSHIVFEQTRVADGIWLPASIEITANAKILFVKNYAMHEVITYSEYCPAQPNQLASTRGTLAAKSNSRGL